MQRTELQVGAEYALAFDQSKYSRKSFIRVKVLSRDGQYRSRGGGFGGIPKEGLKPDTKGPVVEILGEVPPRGAFKPTVSDFRGRVRTIGDPTGPLKPGMKFAVPTRLIMGEWATVKAADERKREEQAKLKAEREASVEVAKTNVARAEKLGLEAKVVEPLHGPALFRITTDEQELLARLEEAQRIIDANASDNPVGQGITDGSYQS